jgi:benzylsuccinate CoA-transferase BbsE subunit
MDSVTGALSGIRVLELPAAMTGYCGKQFADLGAEVILVEPPGGAGARQLDATSPTSGDSLWFSYMNAGKRSIELDLETTAGQEALAVLAAHSDLLLEGERPGSMHARGLGFTTLHEKAPRLVYTSITPFGQSGPYARYEAEDIVLLAMGGLLSLAGFNDSAPTRVWGNQAILAAAQFASVGSIAAVFHAEAHGVGQHVDVSAQECVVMGLENAAQFVDLEGTVRKRSGGAVRFAGTGIFACTDGEVFAMAAGVGEPRFWRNTVAWLREEGVAGVEEIADDKWSNYRFLATPEAKAVFRKIFAPFALTRTKGYLYHEGQRRGTPIVPVASASDLVDNHQLAHRGFFVPYSDGAGGASVMPGAPYKLHGTPWAVQGRAPRPGEHGKEITERFGLGGIAPGALVDKEVR